MIINTFFCFLIRNNERKDQNDNRQELTGRYIRPSQGLTPVAQGLRPAQVYGERRLAAFLKTSHFCSLISKLTAMVNENENQNQNENLMSLPLLDNELRCW